MTEAELLKELDRDAEWVTDRQPGIWKKYRKQILKAGYGDTLLAQTHYWTERKNSVWVIWFCEKWKDEVAVHSMVLHEVMTPRGYEYIAPICNGNGDTSTITFTPHAVDRLKERSGMSFPEFNKYCALNKKGKLWITTYEYEGEEKLVYSLGEYGLFVLTPGPWGFVAQTYVNKELLSDAQTETLEADRENDMIYKKSAATGRKISLRLPNWYGL